MCQKVGGDNVALVIIKSIKNKMRNDSFKSYEGRAGALLGWNLSAAVMIEMFPVMNNYFHAIE